MNTCSVPVLAFDTETAPILEGRIAPPIACLSWAHTQGSSGLVHHTEAEAFITPWLKAASEAQVLLVGHNVVYDMVVLGAEYTSLQPLILAA